MDTVAAGKNAFFSSIKDWLPGVSLSVSGYAIYLVLPIILGIFSTDLKFDEAEIGLISSIELAGLLVGSVAASLLLRFGRDKTVVAAALLVAMLGNAACIYIHDFHTLALVRAVIGCGEGVLYAVGMAWLGRGRDPARNFSFMGVGFIGFGSLGLFAVPLVHGSFGVTGVFLSLASVFVIPAILLWLQLDQVIEAAVDAGTGDVRTNWGPASIALLGIMVFSVSMGGFWAFSERFGESVNIPSASIYSSLNIANLGSLAACWLAIYASRWLGLNKALVISMIILTIDIAFWPSWAGALGYAVWMIVYFQSAAFASVFQPGVLSETDSSGRMTALYPAAQGLGLSLGPWLSGQVYKHWSNYHQVLWAQAALIVISLILFLGLFAMQRRLRRDIVEP